MGDNLIIGLFENSVQIITLDKNLTVDFVSIDNIPFPLRNLLIGKQKNPDYVEVRNKIFSLLPKGTSTFKKVSVVLDSNFFFINTIPLEDTNNIEELKNNILWDIANFYPSSQKNFIINYYKPKETQPKLLSIQEYTIIAIQKNFIKSITNLISDCGLNVTAFYTDHFSAENFLRKYYKEDFSNSILIGCKPERIDISIFNKDNSWSYEFILTDNFDISQPLLKIISKKFIAFEKEQTKMFFYGESYKLIYKILNLNFPQTSMLLLNPFIHIKPADTIDWVLIQNEGYKFTSLFGVNLE
jgi:Tfp pilus assembly PilM family ATPase